jgi:hypothetical protein
MASVEKVGEGVDRLTVPLTKEELLDYGGRLAALESEQANLEEAFEAVRVDHKARLAEVQAKRSALSLAVSTKQVMRDVPVEHWVDWTANVRWVYRLDTGIRYGERPLSAAERQQALEFASSKKAKKASAPEEGWLEVPPPNKKGER